jgi:hypothetical protein
MNCPVGPVNKPRKWPKCCVDLSSNWNLPINPINYIMDIDKIVFEYPINIPLLNKEHPINILMIFMVCWWVFLYSYPMTNPMKPIHLPSIRGSPGTWTSEERQARNQAPPIRTRGLPWRAQSLGEMGYQPGVVMGSPSKWDIWYKTFCKLYIQLMIYGDLTWFDMAHSGKKQWDQPFYG